MEVGEQHGMQAQFEVSDPTHPGSVRRAAVRYAEQLGMGETDRGNVAIAATEMATNVLKHAGHGHLFLDAVGQNGGSGLRLLAVDKGPGIRDVGRALEDGHSTAGTAGTGLGAIRRLSSRFDIYSLPQKGTCVLAEFWPRKEHAPSNSSVTLGVISVPFRGETVCGDGWTYKVTDDGGVLLMLADGLGHGLYAAEAAHEAKRVLQETVSTAPEEIMQDVHDALRKTRGAAVAIARIDQDPRRIRFCGVGNISAVLLRPQHSRGVASHNGTAGHELRKLREFAFPWNNDNMLIMHSDGLSGRWGLSDYPGIWNKPASIIAAVLYRDFSRSRDDATVLVAKSF